MKRLLPLPIVVAVALAGLALAHVGPAGAQRVRLVPIASASSPLHDISLSDLRRAFLGQAVSDGRGGRLMPFNHPPESPLRREFDRAVLGMSPEQVGRHWIAERIRGERSAPRSVPTLPLLIKVVANLPSAIAYAPADNLGADVKPLSIDGKRPGDRAYPLQ